jgi:hypothetical protein
MMFCANLGKGVKEALAMIKQVFREESMSHTWVFEWHARFRVRQVKSRVKSMLITSYHIKRIVYNEFVLADQTLNSAYYCDFYSDCLKMCEEFTLKFGDKELAVVPQHTISHFSHHEIFDQNNMTVVTHPPYFSAFPQLKIKLKGRHFDTIEVIEAESQAVLNILTEHDFQEAYKKMAKPLGMVNNHRRRLPGGRWWPEGPKPVPEIMDATS